MASRTHIIKFGCDDESTPTSGKPCIDFQPDDRWQIKEDEENSDSNSSKCSSRNCTVNSSNKQSEQRLEVTESLKNSSKNNNKTSTTVNGESVQSDSSSDCESKKNSFTEKSKTDYSEVETDQNVTDNLCNSEQSSVLTVCSEVTDQPSRTNGQNTDKSKESSDSKLNACLSETSSTTENSLSTSKEIKNSEHRKRKCSSDELDSDGKKMKIDTTSTSLKSPQDSNSSSSAEETKTITVKENCLVKSSNEDNNKESSVKLENGYDVDNSSQSLNEKKTVDFVKDKSEKTTDLDIDKKKSKESTEEVCVVEDNESDSEVQIIASTADRRKAYDKSLLQDNVTCQMDILLSPGYPYFNSLQEKVKDFKAGAYKPVKFPHTGTLMLEDNEVIIESPSLLVPLLVKEADTFPSLEPANQENGEDSSKAASKPQVPRKNFFQSSVGQFLINLGMSRVNEWYHRDMKRSKLKHLRKIGHDKKLDEAVQLHQKKYLEAKEANAAFTFRLRRCQFCDFKSESRAVLETHLLTPHLSSRREYKCNFCTFQTRDPKEIAFHFEALHGKKAVLDFNMILHECLYCSFQSHLKAKVTVHMNRCRKQFNPAQNQGPPFDFEFPGVTTKPVTITDVIAHRRMLMSSSKGNVLHNVNYHGIPTNDTSLYARKKLATVLNNLSGQAAYPESPTLVKHLMGPHSKQMPSTTSSFQLPPGIVITRPRIRCQQQQQQQQQHSLGSRFPAPHGLGIRHQGAPRNALPYPNNISSTATHLASSGISITPVTKTAPLPAKLPQVVKPGMKNITLTPISSAGNQLVSQKPGPPQPVALFTNVAGGNESSACRARGNIVGLNTVQPSRMPLNVANRPPRVSAPYQRLNTPPSQVVKNSSGNTFVMCEICDSYIKDLEELRSHMNIGHKVKIHPKMLANRPPLNCQKCQWRFFTDQGLERHLLGAHGLVTTNMQEMANKNQDGGRCIICGAVFTYKLVSHMTQVHKVTLKPAHLSYKCTVCTATFTLYRLFENHVYNVHSKTDKRPAEDTAPEPPPVKKPNIEAPKVIAEKPEIKLKKKCKDCNFEAYNLESHLIEKHIKKCFVKLCHINKCEKCLYSSDEMLVIRMSDFEDSDEDDEDSEDDDDDASDESSFKVERIKSESDTETAEEICNDSKDLIEICHTKSKVKTECKDNAEFETNCNSEGNTKSRPEKSTKPVIKEVVEP